MTDSRNPPKPSVLAGFNWAESLRKAEQEGPAAKHQTAPTRPGGPAKSQPQTGPSKPPKGGGPKPQQRLRVKV